MSQVKPLHEYPQQPMHPTVARYLQSLLSSSDEDARVSLATNPNPFISQMLGRIPKEVTVDPRAILFLGTTCDRPAVAVMYAYSLTRLAKAQPGNTVLLEHVMRAYSEGLPPLEVLKRAWEEQKTGGGINRLDEEAAWK